MRFHMGISFRFKTLKKFLIPILIGIASYFGLSFFNIDIVHAFENTNTGYYLNYTDYDFSNLTYGDYSFNDIWDLLTSPSEHYYIALNMNRQGFINVYFIPKSQNGSVIYAFARGNVSDFFMNSSNAPSGAFQLMYPIGSTFDSTRYDVIYNCLYNNEGCNNYSYFTSSLSTLQLNRVTSPSGINNNNSYSWNLPQDVFSNQYEAYMFLYSNYEYIKYQYLGSGSTSSSTFYKSIYLNDTLINNNDRILAYCDFVDCSSFGNGGNDNGTFDIYLDKVPFIYTNTYDLSNYSMTLNFSPSVLGVQEYVDNWLFKTYYYGRVNHGTYYTYEKLSCTSSSVGSFDDYTISLTTSNVQCSNNLSNYDKFFITYYSAYDDSSLNPGVKSFTTNINHGTIETTTLFASDLYDDFSSLNRGFKVLLSSKINDRDSYAYVESSNKYVAFDYISNASGNMDLTTNGDWYYNIPLPKRFTFGHVTNKNLLIYDDISYSSDSSTDLKLYVDYQTMVSFVDNDTFTYYDSNNNITTSTILLTYDNVDSGTSYDLDSYFQTINDFINSINNDLLNYHNILENVYNSIPMFLQTFILVIYILFLTYLLFRFMRK